MKYLLSIMAMVLSFSSIAQPPAPACGDPSVITYADPILCGQNCAKVHAIVNGENPLPSGITADDRYSNIIPIGFTFNYYGVPYTQCVIGSNGMINFDLSLALSYDPWPISAALLGNTSAYNCICGPWCDIFPPAGGIITYATSGVAPFRRFTATWCHVPMYYCNDQWTTTQIILYEGCDLIDVQVGHKTTCAAWNGAYAIIGVQNSTGTNATVAPARDFPAIYSCTDEAWRFTPVGGGYVVAPTAYAPVPNNGGPITWYSGPPGTGPIGSGPTLDCVPYGGAYRAEVAGCDFISSSTVSVRTDTGTTSSGRIIVCAGASAPLPSLPPGGFWTGGPGSIAILLPAPPPGSVVGIMPGVATYIYTYGEECTFVLTVEVIRCDCVDTCYWTVSGNTIHGGKNIFGTLSNDDIRILSNNTDRAVIQAGGNIGIKQLTPTTTFDVDCVPVVAPSGLRFENLPFGGGNHLVVDANGYVYVSPGVVSAREENAELREMINQLKQQFDDLKTQLNAAGITTLQNNSGNSLTATPNPTNGQISINYTIAGKFSSAAIRITDNQGRLVSTTPVSNNAGAIPITIPASVVPGNLVIALLVDNKVVATQKEVLLK